MPEYAAEQVARMPVPAYKVAALSAIAELVRRKGV